jgi:histidinol-phosphate aminotransferase
MSSDRAPRSGIGDLVAPGVRSLQPYVPGKPISELEREYGVSDIVKLCSNENPLGPGPLARAAMNRALGDIGLYPDGNGYDLKVRLARHHDLPMECITLGNGSNDVLVLLAQAFLTSEAEAVYSQYCFAVYPIAVQAVGATAREAPAFPASHEMALGHDAAAIAARITPRTRLVFIANPNNPTGTWLGERELLQLLEAIPPTAVAVVDEAYFEYSRAVCPDSTRWLGRLRNLVVTRTFSKAHGLAGLRVGYALSSPEIADVLNRVRQPFNVNSVALAAATAALDDVAHVEKTLALNSEGGAQLRSGIEAMGLKVLPSAGNFLLVDLGRPSGPVHENLLRSGVIARPVGSYGLPNHLRVTTGTHEQNARFLDALREAMSSRR